jgi:hypothetical protein
MTAIQVILNLALLLCFVYAFSQRAQSRLVFTSLSMIVILGMVFVWHPDAANRIANLVGVGRGADLVLYVFVVISLVVVFNLHIKNKKNGEYITELAREITLLRAQHLGQPPRASTPQSATGD